MIASAPEGVSLMDETNNDQSKNKSKCDFDLFFIFNNLTVIENNGTFLCRGASEFFRGSLTNILSHGARI